MKAKLPAVRLFVTSFERKHRNVRFFVFAFVEFNNTISKCKNGMILTKANVKARVMNCSALSDDADILVYGCNFAAGEKGAEAVMLLAGLTGADVAASEDLTGAARQGGDWDLETRIGLIEAGLIDAPVNEDVGFGREIGADRGERRAVDRRHGGGIENPRVINDPW